MSHIKIISFLSFFLLFSSFIPCHGEELLWKVSGDENSMVLLAIDLGSSMGQDKIETHGKFAEEFSQGLERVLNGEGTVAGSYEECTWTISCPEISMYEITIQGKNRETVKEMSDIIEQKAGITGTITELEEKEEEKPTEENTAEVREEILVDQELNSNLYIDESGQIYYISLIGIPEKLADKITGNNDITQNDEPEETGKTGGDKTGISEEEKEAFICNLFQALSKNDMKKAREIIEITLSKSIPEEPPSKWLFNEYNETGETPLHLAVLQANPEIVELLVDNGADGTLKNTKGLTPAELAHKKMEEEPGRYEIIVNIFESK